MVRVLLKWVRRVSRLVTLERRAVVSGEGDLLVIFVVRNRCYCRTDTSSNWMGIIGPHVMLNVALCSKLLI